MVAPLQAEAAKTREDTAEAEAEAAAAAAAAAANAGPDDQADEAQSNCDMDGVHISDEELARSVVERTSASLALAGLRAYATSAATMNRSTSARTPTPLLRSARTTLDMAHHTTTWSSAETAAPAAVILVGTQKNRSASGS